MISIAVMAMLILISSCSTASKERFDPRKVADGEILSMIEGYNRLEGAVFMGVSGPYSNMETAYSKAMENAAIMALFKESHLVEGTATNFYFFEKDRMGVWRKLEPSFNRL